MATVYLARLSGAGGFQRFVAIKRLHPHLANDNEFIQMFLDEARLAARLHHPNVVPIVEIGESPEGYYLVMEYIEGDTVARILARSAQSGKPLPTGTGVRMLLDTLAGLHAAHELLDDDGKPLNIVHRDVSPQNILVGVDGTSRITDFGVARAATRLSTTRTGQLKGKLAYMAPEQARGKDVDRRADIFAMGIVAWETLAQRRLFKGEGEADTLNRVLYEPIPLLRSANPAMPEALEQICSKALEREAEKRFETCADFADALEKAARAAGVYGSHKDVQTHLTAVMGSDISQQRDAVRAWLSRSEPSRPHDPRLHAPASRQELTPAPMRSSPSSPAGASAPGVSSVSSAVMELPPGFGAQPPPVAAAVERPRSRAWLPIAAVGLVVFGGASVYAFGLRDKSTVASSGTSSATLTSASAPPSKVEPPPSASAAAAETRAPPATTPPPTPTVAITTAPTTHSTARPTGTAKPTPTTHASGANTGAPQATATATKPTVPDDISNNPYR